MKGNSMEQRLKVLKAMSEVTGHMDMKQFAKTVNLTSSQTIEQIRRLVKAGFVKKSGSGYSITEEGKNALKAVVCVPEGKEFQFYVGLDQPAGFSAATVKDFCEAVKQVDEASIDFHLYRGDFENWVRAAVNDDFFADELMQMKTSELKGESLRKEIVKAIEERYSVQ
jgi:DNA-binding Lrp family transcriptional regulator